MAEKTAPTNEKEFRQKGPIGKGIHIVAWIFGTVSISLFFSIIGEWLGMTYVWEEQGVQHSRDVLVNEIAYLNENFSRRFYMNRSIAQIAVDTATTVQNWLYYSTGFSEFRTKMTIPINAYEPSFLSWLKGIYLKIDDYFFAAINSIQVFVVRLLVILLSTPAFLLFGFAAFVDGLVQRDLRKYGGGIERAFVYHKAKALLRPPVIVLPALIYLALPVSLNPSFIFMPAMLFFGLTIFIVAATFKKFL